MRPLFCTGMQRNICVTFNLEAMINTFSQDIFTSRLHWMYINSVLWWTYYIITGKHFKCFSIVGAESWGLLVCCEGCPWIWTMTIHSYRTASSFFTVKVWTLTWPFQDTNFLPCWTMLFVLYHYFKENVTTNNISLSEVIFLKNCIRSTAVWSFLMHHKQENTPSCCHLEWNSRNKCWFQCRLIGFS